MTDKDRSDLIETVRGAIYNTWHKDGIANVAGVARIAVGAIWARTEAARAESAKELAEKDAEIERLKGLLWYSWYEMNAIRARDGSPEHVCPDYWNRIVDAFETALGEDCTPWPSEAAKKAIATTKKEG
jgi:hypothetical protein